ALHRLQPPTHGSPAPRRRSPSVPESLAPAPAPAAPPPPAVPAAPPGGPAIELDDLLADLACQWRQWAANGVAVRDEDRVDDLLAVWEMLCDAGQEVPLERLCRDHPQLTQRVVQGMAKLRRMRSLERLAPAADDPLEALFNP